MILTEEEKLLVLAYRKEKADAAARRERQNNCSHLHKVFEGRFGHNGDEWYLCKDCGANFPE